MVEKGGKIYDLSIDTFETPSLSLSHTHLTFLVAGMHGSMCVCVCKKGGAKGILHSQIKHARNADNIHI